MDLQARLALDIRAWMPKTAGDSLIGEVVEVTEAVSEFGSYPRVIVVDYDGQGWAFNAFHTVAKSELSKLRPRPGDQLGVVYLGKADGKNYAGYRVVVERKEPTTAPEPNWAGHAQRAEEDLGWEQRLSDAPVDEAPPPDDEF